MTDASPTQRDWRDTVFLPKTDFPMKAGLAAKEPAILARWEAIGLYQRLREMRAGRERFILHDGPPYANGDIHMGHAMNKVLKDIIVRSQSLMGKDAPYVPGWDCHGLPIEWKVEEAYRAKKLDKDQVPVARFRAECRAYADKWVAVQRDEFKRLGVMGDWDDPYLTMKYEAEAAIVGELLKFAESGQLYRGARPVMWSPVEKTALAEAEVEYEDIVSTQIDVAFEIVDAPNAPELVGAHAVIWTTTPWTIPVNQALAYGPEIEYVVVTEGDRRYLIGEDLLFDFYFRAFSFKRPGEGRGPVSDRSQLDPGLRRGTADADSVERGAILWRGKGSALEGATARHPIANFLSPLPFRGGAGGGASQHAALPAEAPHPNPASGRSSSQPDLNRAGRGLPDAPEGEGLNRNSPLAEFFLRPRPFLPGDFVTTDAGTGLVHMAPDHGEDDFELCKAHGIDPVYAVEADGMYRADWGWLPRTEERSRSVINDKFTAPDGPICSDLRDAGALLSASAFPHSYPKSWRSKAKVIFRATPQWFIPMDRSATSDLPVAGRSAEVGSRSEASAFAARPLSPALSPEGEREKLSNAATLRETALDAIARTRWVPPRAENRITAMVQGRPDWVISRQRAWGVPIAVYVHRQTGEYLIDPAVNARIVAAFEAGGADAWFTADHADLLGPDYAAADYAPVNDILDVWFDSGCTHVFTVEARYGADARADLYVEGSDQHRGWFQSSLLESCGTRGRAPYAAVLTHGFALDGQGRKMSKSLGNVVDPLKIIGESGADILRMWVASTDYFDDVKIGKEVLATASDAYRKLRNTFRYLLGALDGFDESERVVVADMPELERYILHRLAGLDGELRRAAEAFEFNRYIRALTDFAQDDLSAFFFDVRKDSLYCDAADDPKRRAYRTVLDTLFHALVRYAAPILCFTAEETWQARFPSEDGSVHLLEWPLDVGLIDENLAARWDGARIVRSAITEAIEPLRRHKIIRSSLEAEIDILLDDENDLIAFEGMDFAEIGIVASAGVERSNRREIAVRRTERHKCGRCWRHLSEVTEDGALCARCADAVGAEAVDA